MTRRAKAPVGGGGPAGGSSNRFNGQAYLDAYTQARSFPKIHDLIFAAAVSEVRGKRAVDLCCSTGLLGARLRDRLRMDVCFVETDEDAITRGRAAGTFGDRPVWHDLITPESLPSLQAFLTEQRVDLVVARRCLCVVSEACDLALVRDAFAAAGVLEVLLEGQTQDARSVHPFGSADRQVAALAPVYRNVPIQGGGKDVRYLRLA